MRITFWGTRGSIPVAQNSAAVRRKLQQALLVARGRRFADAAAIDQFIDAELEFTVSHTFGGNSSCVQIDAGALELLICDMGSGARELGNRILKERGADTPQTYHVLMSHLHWDHMMGFPFFVPIYIPGNHIHIYGCHSVLEQAFRAQHSAPGFPVPFDALSAEIEFHRLTPGQTVEIAGCQVTPKLQTHSGDSYGFRIENAGKVVIYSTDGEHKQEDGREMEAFAEFFREADLVIFDAMYSLAEATTVKADWGHSSNIVGVELCQMARARHLCLYHHEPANDDETLYSILLETRRYEELARNDHAVAVSAAYDGMVIEL